MANKDITSSEDNLCKTIKSGEVVYIFLYLTS